jgi:hypothetical protein
MTTSNSNPDKALIANVTPKTTMGSGVAPPRIVNRVRVSSDQLNNRQQSILMNTVPTVCMGSGMSPTLVLTHIYVK